MATSTAFRPKSAKKTVAASVASAQAKFTPTETGDCLRVHNTTIDIAYIKWGNGDQTATSDDYDIAPLSVEVIGIPDGMDTVAVLLAAGTGDVSLIRGEGI